MNEQDWIKLCKNIYEKKCILMLGSDFPVETLDKNNVETPTTFSHLISEKILEEITACQKKKFQQLGLGDLPVGRLANFENKELTQLATDYINITDSDKKICRENLEMLISNYMDEVAGQINSQCFGKLATLPFTFIVDTNHSNFFYEQLQNAKKSPKKAYYNFKGDKVDLLRIKSGESDESIGTEFEPFVYNLFGSTEDTCSMVVSENDMIQFIINIISKNPGLPADIKAELANSEKCFLFMGFGFRAKNWYFRILLNALESGNKERMSYALEYLNNMGNSDNLDPTVLYFRDELKVSIFNCDNRQFIDTLMESYKKYEDKRVIRNKDIAVPPDAPKAFISYKSEDYETVQKIYMRLRAQGIDAWLDKERLSGRWSESIKNEIQSSNAFVLIQSKTLKESPVNYVNVEIKEALERARYYMREEEYFFPSFIDSRDSILSEPSLLSEIQSWDITSIEFVDRLAKDIRRSYERNKKTKAA